MNSVENVVGFNLRFSQEGWALCRRWYILMNFEACISLTSKSNIRLCLYKHYTVSKIRKLFFSWLNSPSGPGPPHYRGFTMTLRHTTLVRSPLDEWWTRRKNLYLTTHNTTDIHVAGGIRNCSPNKRAAADPRPRRSVHWHRQKEQTHINYSGRKKLLLLIINIYEYTFVSQQLRTLRKCKN